MSGIAGFYYLDGRQAERPTLQAMLARILHRGPDGSGIWTGGSVGLAHCMLWTTPESLRERQPMLSAHADLVLTADSRLDNRADLIMTLELDTRPVGKITDAGLLLRAYQVWGEDCPGKLVGDFAFALWDRHNARLFCARDHLGVRPFYYYQSDRLFAFASEIKALWALPEVPRKINQVRIADHLAFQVEDRQVTFYEQIHRLPPASVLKIQDGSPERRTYWSLDPSREIRFSREQDYESAFQEIFDEAVRCRLRAQGQIGSLLSGGLDSSSITFLAKKSLNNGRSHLHTYSAIFSHLPESVLPTIDERKYVELAVGAGGFLPSYVETVGLGPLSEQADLFSSLDEVYMAPNLYMHLALYRAANANGVRVLLDGTDGDATVSHGYAYLSDLARGFRWLDLYRQASLVAEREGAYASARGVIQKHALRPLVPERAVTVRRYLAGDRQPRWLSNSVLRPEFVRDLRYDERVRSLMAAHAGPRSARYQHWRETDTGSTSLSLELVDKLSSMLSIELRYPFYDKRLVEFCLALPADQKLSNGWTRAILRQAMEGVIPEGIRQRTSKANFIPAFGLSMLAHEQEILEEVLFSDTQIIEPYVDISRLREMYARYRSNPAGSALESQLVYSAASLALWLKWVDKAHRGR